MKKRRHRRYILMSQSYYRRSAQPMLPQQGIKKICSDLQPTTWRLQTGKNNSSRLDKRFSGSKHLLRSSSFCDIINVQKCRYFINPFGRQVSILFQTEDNLLIYLYVLMRVNSMLRTSAFGFQIQINEFIVRMNKGVIKLYFRLLIAKF